MENVNVMLVIKEKLAVKNIVMIIVQVMDIASIINVSVTKNGSVLPVRKLLVLMTVATMEYALKENAFVNLDFQEKIALLNLVLTNAQVMVDVRKAYAFVKLDGLQKIAQFDHVKTVVLVTDYVTQIIINANVTRTTLAPIVE